MLTQNVKRFPQIESEGHWHYVGVKSLCNWFIILPPYISLINLAENCNKLPLLPCLTRVVMLFMSVVSGLI